MAQKRIILTIVGFVISMVLVFGKANEPLEHKERHLGPTGIYGVTTDTGISVVRVEPGSPADGKLMAGQLITGFGGDPIQGNTRKSLADAIDHAQSERGSGKLHLDLSTGESVSISLPVEGEWVATAPSQCEKCEMIVTKAADYILANQDYGRFGFGFLGLLATGEDAYIAEAGVRIREMPWAQPTVIVRTDHRGNNWAHAALTKVLAEYYALTGDQFVYPALEKYALGLVAGREGGGLWGHHPPVVPGGKAGGYAAIHAVSAQCYLALVLAEKAGVADPRVREAIESARSHFRSFLYRGALPYWIEGTDVDDFSDNGMSAMVALALAHDGDLHGAEYFARSSLTAHRKIEKGHTGHYYAQFWCGLGANLCGPFASTRFFEKTRWLTTLNKRWDGNFTYDDSERIDPKYSYNGLSMAGSHLVNLCRKKRVLMITGKGVRSDLWLSDSDVEETVGVFELQYAQRSNDDLLRMIQNPVRVIRRAALSELNQRNHGLHSVIVGWFSTGDDFAKMGALDYLRSQPLSDQKKGLLVDVMSGSSHSLILRYEAAEILLDTKAMSSAEFQALLQFFMADHVGDRFKALQGRLGKKMDLCFFGIGVSWPSTEADFETFYELIQLMANNPYDETRKMAMHCASDVSEDQFYRVASVVEEIARNERNHYRSHTWFGARKRAIGILGSKNIEEGMLISLNLINEPYGTHVFKLDAASVAVSSFGTSGKKYLSEIKAIDWGRRTWSMDRYIGQLEAETAPEEMVTMESVLWRSLQSRGAVDEAMWKEAQFTKFRQEEGHSDSNADPDGDGLVNFVEYALGTDPWVANGGVIGIETVGEDRYFVFERPGGLIDVDLRLQVSETLGEWNDQGVTEAVNVNGRIKMRSNRSYQGERGKFGRILVSPR